MAIETVLTSPFFMQIALPFLLVFTIAFAILQRTKILGEDKTRIDAITALVIALIVVAYSYATNIIVVLMPFLAVSAVIILIFMILYGFIASDEKGFKMNKGLKIAFGILIGIAIVIAVISASGYWGILIGWFTGKNSSSIITNIIFVAIIIAAIAVVVSGKGNSSSSGTSSSS